MRYFLLFAVLTTAHFTLGQTTFFVKDASTLEPIPFVKVYPSEGSPLISDLDGAFQIDTTATSVQFRASGYRDTLVHVQEGITVFTLAPRFQEIEAVIVYPGENPAHRIIENAIQARKQNDPERNDAFTYESYSKFVFDINRGVLDSVPANTTDTNLIEMKQLFDSQHLFMVENVTTRAFIPPNKDRETVLGYKTSGIHNSLFATFAAEMQLFSFYDEQISILGVSYLNPISPGSTQRYLFILEDTTIVGQDTTYTIAYRPRKNKHFEALTGHLYINTNGFAIERVTASPFRENEISRVTIVQEYQLLGEKKWFPSKLYSQIDFHNLLLYEDIPGSYLQGKGTTYIKNIRLNPAELNAKQLNNITTVVADDASELTPEIWDSLRVYPITSREQHTYIALDSLSKVHGFNKRFDLLTTLMEGKLPLWKFDLDLTRIIDFNEYEGYRFGAGMETSKRLFDPIQIGGYYAWATRDKASKFGGYSRIHFSRKKGIRLDLKYQEDVVERGGTKFRTPTMSFFSNNYLSHFFLENMDRQRIAELLFSFRIQQNFHVTLFGNYQRMWFTDGYTYLPTDKNLSTPLTQTDFAETGLEIQWNIREKSMLLDNQLFPKGTKYPKLKLQAIRGWKDVYESEFDYYRLRMDVSHDLPVRGAGRLQWTLSASQTFGDVPLTIMQRATGTGKNWLISVPNSFETMNASGFYSERQLALFTRFLFSSFKTKAKWNEPQIGVHHAIGYGDFPNKTLHSVSFRSMDQGYYEGGLLLNNLFVSGVSGFGIGAFYHYGVYSSADWTQNIMFKFSLSFVM